MPRVYLQRFQAEGLSFDPVLPEYFCWAEMLREKLHEGLIYLLEMAIYIALLF